MSSAHSGAAEGLLTVGATGRRIVNAVQHDTITFLATSAETAGERTLARQEVAPGGRVIPHHHLSYTERFEVLEGRLDVQVGDERLVLGPGDAVTVPMGARHAWSNQGPDRAVAEVELRPGQPATRCTSPSRWSGRTCG